jgi:hypothetical protein
MGRGWELYASSVQWNIGSGSSISLWFDNWLGLGTLRSLIFGPLNRGEENLLISSFPPLLITE